MITLSSVDLHTRVHRLVSGVAAAGTSNVTSLQTLPQRHQALQLVSEQAVAIRQGSQASGLLSILQQASRCFPLPLMHSSFGMLASRFRYGSCV